MPNGYLTKIEAKKSWVLRALGMKVRDIQSRFDVDPRRLYVVWEQKVFPEAKDEAIWLFERFRRMPAPRDLFKTHVPRKEVKEKPTATAPRLPGL